MFFMQLNIKSGLESNNCRLRKWTGLTKWLVNKCNRLGFPLTIKSTLLNATPWVSQVKSRIERSGWSNSIRLPNYRTPLPFVHFSMYQMNALRTSTPLNAQLPINKNKIKRHYHYSFKDLLFITIFFFKTSCIISILTQVKKLAYVKNL